MHIARLSASDASQYRDMMLQAYEHCADAFKSTAEERAAEPIAYWQSRIENPAGLSVALGAFEGQALVGTVALEYSAKPKTKHKALVIGMYTVPSAQNRGIGRALIERLLQEARTREGLSVLTLTFTQGNLPAERLYTRAGFQVFGVEPMAILTPSGYKSKVHMWLPLQHAPAAV